MIDFPCAKINFGLNVVGKRADGYHNLQTVFFPVSICDALEIKPMDERFPSDVACDLKITGQNVDCDENDNLIVKAYNLIAADYDIPRVHAHLYKNIPSGAGLGGGSSDAAFMIKLLDQRFRMNMGNAEMENYAVKLGADCPFFIAAEPSYAEGIGEKLSPVKIAEDNLRGYTLVIIKPNIFVSTKEAFTHIRSCMPTKCCREIVSLPVEEWKGLLKNDFEESVFRFHPQLSAIKQELYSIGAVYAQMSGSGSALFGIFNKDMELNAINKMFMECRCFVIKI